MTRRSIVAAVEAVMVMMVVMMSAIPGHHDYARIVTVMMPIEAMVMMMVVVMMVELSHLDVFSRLSWSGFVNGLQQCDGIRDRLQQVGV
jgi:O-antigen/teichoic acid export membrane protein